MENKIEYKIDANQLQILINYLSKKPYDEVFQLIEFLIKLEKINSEKNKTIA